MSSWDARGDLQGYHPSDLDLQSPTIEEIASCRKVTIESSGLLAGQDRVFHGLSFDGVQWSLHRMENGARLR